VDDPYLPYCDVYALCAERSLRLARELLDGWAPKREWSAAEIAIPIGGDRMFHSDEDALAWLIEHPTAEQTLYWRSRRDDHIEHVMLGFTCDGHMIAGISASFQELRDHAQLRRELAQLLVRLAHAVGGRYGYVAYEEPPVEDGGFIAECSRRDVALIDGQLSDVVGT
jgi:hypothetical protein